MTKLTDLRVARFLHLENFTNDNSIVRMVNVRHLTVASFYSFRSENLTEICNKLDLIFPCLESLNVGLQSQRPEFVPPLNTGTLGSHIKGLSKTNW